MFELTERNPECLTKVTDIYINMTCSVKFAGNWAPTMEWKMQKSQNIEIKLVSSQSGFVSSNVFLPLNFSACNISVVTQFRELGRPKDITATNVPDYMNTITPYSSG